MKKIFKGKVKYDFWIGMGTNTTKFMIVCAIAELIAFSGIYLSGENIDIAALLFIFGISLVVGYFYNRYYNSLLSAWDKPGFETLSIDDKAKIICLDKSKIINFANIEKIAFEKCVDRLPRLPKTYDVINAQMTIYLQSNEKITYYVQTLSVIYKLIAYLRDLSINVTAEGFDNNIRYKLRAHYFLCILAGVAIIFVFLLKFG